MGSDYCCPFCARGSRPPNSQLRQSYDYPHGSPDDVAEPITDRLAVLPDGILLRRTPPGQPTVDEVVRPGTLVDTGYDQRRKVFKVIERERHGLQTFGLALGNLHADARDDGLPKRYSGENVKELVYQDGAIRHLFWENDREVEVVGYDGVGAEYQATLEAGWSA